VLKVVFTTDGDPFGQIGMMTKEDAGHLADGLLI
jgi:hypothetical protein